MKKTKQAIAVIGLGYVGLPLALHADQKGYRVIGVDVDEVKIEKLARRESPLHDAEIAQQLARTGMEPTTDFSRIQDAAIIIVCVPTPVHENHEPDLAPLRAACTALGSHLQRGQLVILESTVNPGVCETVVLPILEARSGLKGGTDFDLAHCPERINPGDEKWRVGTIPRVVGGLDAISLKRAAAFYRTLVGGNGNVKPMGSLKEAEAVKIVENTFRDVNIAFVNELAVSFSRLGIDVVRVVEGASTKPFGFMPFYPGAGVGGHCIPVDPYYLIKYAEENGFHHRFLSLAREINEGMPRFAVDLLAELMRGRARPLEGAEVAVLGLAYKPEVDDPRESPSFEVIRLLEKKKVNVRTYDPYLRAQSTAKSVNHALADADAAIVMTAHDAFKSLRPHDFLKHGIAAVVDGRNCLPKDDFIKAGVAYRGIGR
ncbi:MAG: nucleotide sugar dehydrogenase [Chloroflexi bacterium]|nr:nucleotide sugar dehydrogenase [Chloroflexota bacterium]